MLVVSWISSKGPPVRGQLREKQGSQTRAGAREKEDLSGEGAAYMGQEPLRSTRDKRVRDRARPRSAIKRARI